MERRFGPGVDDQEAAFSQLVDVGMVVQDLAVHGQNGRESGGPGVGDGQAVDAADDVLLIDARLGHTHGRLVHLVGGLQSRHHLGHFLVGLDRALPDDRLHESGRNLGLGLNRRNSQEGLDFQAMFGPIRRQEMDRPSLGRSGPESLDQGLHRARVFDADQCRPVLERG